MPLSFVNHQPPELMQELRALWAKADELARRTHGLEGSGVMSAPGPAVTVVGDGYMRAFWAQVSIDEPDVALAAIGEGYTIVNVWLFVVSRPAAGPSVFRGQVYATGSYVDWIGDGTTIIGTDPEFASWAYTDGNPRAPAMQLLGTLQRTPIYPVDAHALRLKITSTWPNPATACYHAVVFGTYILHPKAFFPGVCP